MARRYQAHHGQTVVGIFDSPAENKHGGSTGDTSALSGSVTDQRLDLCTAITKWMSGCKAFICVGL
jgi:hypothetical protein